MTSQDTRTTTADAIPAEAALLSRERGEVEDPIHRVSYSFRHDGSDLWVYSWLEDGGHLPEHYHPVLEEHWETLEGSARVKLDGTWRDLVPPTGRSSSGATSATRSRTTAADSPGCGPG
jgi:hypothetical protein